MSAHGKTARRTAVAFFCFFLVSLTGAAQNVRIVAQEIDGDRFGATVLHVWGTNYEMGFGMGAALAPDIVALVQEARLTTGSDYMLARTAVQVMDWSMPGLEDELAGIIDGVHAAIPLAAVDTVDLKVINAIGDLYYVYFCRSHACWGRYVSEPVLTLSTRRLDFPVLFEALHRHVLCAWDPDDGIGWVNLGWAGFVTVATAVNEYGTQVSLHDFGEARILPGVTSRGAAARVLTADVGEMPLAGQLDWAALRLSEMNVATTTFLNVFIPEGHAGVFTCVDGICGPPRLPQADYLFGEAILTTNDETDGHTAPGGGEFMEAYYEEGWPKTMESHYDLMGHGGLQLMTVAYRGRGDMTIRFEGELPGGVTDRIEVEWRDLFNRTEPDAEEEDESAESIESMENGEEGDAPDELEDAGDRPPTDEPAESSDAPPDTAADAAIPAGDEGCACVTAG